MIRDCFKVRDFIVINTISVLSYLLTIWDVSLQAKKTPLHMAAQNGQMEVCNTLLKMKADANATDVVRPEVQFTHKVQICLLRFNKVSHFEYLSSAKCDLQTKVI